ncbi:hypothetical protein SGLAM104S_08050 [Streptomyces glaucescens]
MSNASYADSMRAAYEQAPDDLDVATLYADALVGLTPWQLWDLRTGEPAEGARTRDARAVLDRALDAPGGRDHPGVPAPLHPPDGDVPDPRRRCRSPTG